MRKCFPISFVNGLNFKKLKWAHCFTSPASAFLSSALDKSSSQHLKEFITNFISCSSSHAKAHLHQAEDSFLLRHFWSLLRPPKKRRIKWDKKKLAPRSCTKSSFFSLNLPIKWWVDKFYGLVFFMDQLRPTTEDVSLTLLIYSRFPFYSNREFGLFFGGHN